MISVEGLSKKFATVLAVDNISFNIEAGQTCALLGGNGAGKTTTLSILLGLLLPSAGKATIMGADMATNRYKVLPLINFTSPYVDLPRRLTVQQNLQVYARLYGVKPKAVIARLARDLDFEAFLNRPYGSLSAGQRTRVALAKALLNEPQVLLMDEPTASLDPDTADRVRSYLLDYKKKTQATILLATHNMMEVERLCDAVIVMKNGRVMDTGSVDELLVKYQRTNMEEVFIEIARAP